MGSAENIKAAGGMKSAIRQGDPGALLDIHQAGYKKLLELKQEVQSKSDAKLSNDDMALVHAIAQVTFEALVYWMGGKIEEIIIPNTKPTESVH